MHADGIPTTAYRQQDTHGVRLLANGITRTIGSVTAPNDANDLGQTPGDRIRTLRERRGLSQTELAVALGKGVTQARVSSWERNEAKPTKWIQRLCEFFGVSAEQIWDGRSLSSLGVEEVRNEELAKVLASKEWAELPETKRSALAVLLNDVDVEEWEVRSVMATLLKGWQPGKTKRRR